MNRLIAFFDVHCTLCRACRRWIEREPKYFPIEFIAYQSNRAREVCPDLDAYDPAGEIVVLADTGAIYRGGKAWIMCLYALRNYREWALRLAQPGLLPMAKKFCHIISDNRRRLSILLPNRSEAEVRRELEALSTGLCASGICATEDPKSQ